MSGSRADSSGADAARMIKYANTRATENAGYMGKGRRERTADKEGEREKKEEEERNTLGARLRI